MPPTPMPACGGVWAQPGDRRAWRDRRRHRRRQRLRRAEPAAADRRRRATGLRGLGALQEMEQVALLRPITKGAWSVSETRQIPEVLTTAIRTALSGRPGPVFVEIPVDLLMNRIEDRLAPIPTSYVHRAPQPADADAVSRLAQLLSRAQRPVVMAGSGVWWDDAAKALAAFAESRRRAGLHERRRPRVPGLGSSAGVRAGPGLGSTRPISSSCSAPRSISVWGTAGRRRSRTMRPCA